MKLTTSQPELLDVFVLPPPLPPTDVYVLAPQSPVVLGGGGKYKIHPVTLLTATVSYIYIYM